MSELETALQRLQGAVARLEAAVEDGAKAAGGALPDAERARLIEEVGRLREEAAEDARLRAEAASAVRSALDDLRGAVRVGDA